MKAHAVRIEDISESELENLLETIAAEKKNKINKFIFKKDKFRAIISEILLRTMLAQEFGINVETMFFRKNKYEKPYLECSDNEYIFKQFDGFNGYKLSICSLNKEIIKDIIEVKQSTLINGYYKLI